MAKRKVKKDDWSEFPPELLVYVCDHDDGKPLFVAAESADDVEDGQVAVYVRKNLYTKSTKSVLEPKD